ncbi:MAG: hypothetical protein M3Z64_01060 [Verrucomicrobiota bacterium]|nr:hypothetical protein [Verrucomicrobiota bacterium]
MKRLLAFALAAASLLATPSLDAASARENQRIREGKITKIEAQHLVLRKYPHATIKKCELTRGKEHSVWMLDVVKAGASDVTKIQVDGRDGKILP